MPTQCSRRLLPTVLVLLASACGDSSLAPGTLGQAYMLVDVASDPLPTTLYVNEIGTIRVIAQTIRFGPKGTGSLSQRTEIVPHAADQPREGPEEYTFGIGWVQVKGSIEIEFDCPANANCLAGPHLIARVDGHALRATWGPQMNGRAPLRYEEVPPPQ